VQLALRVLPVLTVLSVLAALLVGWVYRDRPAPPVSPAPRALPARRGHPVRLGNRDSTVLWVSRDRRARQALLDRLEQ